LTKSFVVLIIGNSKSNYLGAQGTLNKGVLASDKGVLAFEKGVSRLEKGRFIGRVYLLGPTLSRLPRCDGRTPG